MEQPGSLLKRGREAAHLDELPTHALERVRRRRRGGATRERANRQLFEWNVQGIR
jgi:hypothetical protein